jgi:hypothetical protein
MISRFEHFDAGPGGSYRLVLAYADASAAREVAVDSDVVDPLLHNCRSSLERLRRPLLRRRH